MVKCEIGEEVRLLVIEGVSNRQARCQRGRMAATTSNRFEQCLTIDDRLRTGLASRTARRRGLIHEAHEGHERHDIGRFVFHIETGVILGQMVGRALRVLASFSWEKLIGDTYLDVIRFAGKQ